MSVDRSMFAGWYDLDVGGHVIRGLLTEHDLNSLAYIAQQTSGLVEDAVEIGSAYGLSAYMFVSNFVNNRKLHCVDYFLGETHEIGRTFRKNMKAVGCLDRIVIHPGDFRALSKDDLPNKISLAFIDHDHMLATTKAAYDLLWPRIVSGGILSFHDYLHPDYPGPHQYMRELPGHRILERPGLLAIRKD